VFRLLLEHHPKLDLGSPAGTSSALSWPHPLKGWSLRITRCDSISFTGGIPGRPLVKGVGENFYRADFHVLYTEGSVIVSAMADGTGDISVDDVIVIRVVMPNGTATLFRHDFSNGCQGFITPIPPVNIASNVRCRDQPLQFAVPGPVRDSVDQACPRKPLTASHEQHVGSHPRHEDSYGLNDVLPRRDRPSEQSGLVHLIVTIRQPPRPFNEQHAVVPADYDLN